MSLHPIRLSTPNRTNPIKLIGLGCFLVLLLSGCSEKEIDPAASSVAPSSSSAHSAANDDLVEACLSTTNMTRALCECIDKKAADELTTDGYAFLVASLTEDDAETERLRSEMSVQETMQAGMFMASAPASCAKDAANQ